MQSLAVSCCIGNERRGNLIPSPSTSCPKSGRGGGRLSQPTDRGSATEQAREESARTGLRFFCVGVLAVAPLRGRHLLFDIGHVLTASGPRRFIAHTASDWSAHMFLLVDSQLVTFQLPNRAEHSTSGRRPARRRHPAGRRRCRLPHLGLLPARHLVPQLPHLAGNSSQNHRTPFSRILRLSNNC